MFKILKRTKGWNSFLETYPELNKEYTDGLNKKLIAGLKELVALDQKDYGQQAKGKFDRSKLKASTEKIDSLLIPLLNNEGFPSEEKVGTTVFRTP
jgi:hypothetical protein